MANPLTCLESVDAPPPSNDGVSLFQQSACWDRFFYLFFTLLTLIALSTFRDYGYSMDEVWHNRWNGQAILHFFATLGQDRSAVTEYDFSLYGGTFDLAAETLVRLSPLEPRNTRHLANLLAGLACLWGTRQFARFLGGPMAGCLAAFCLAATAPFYGHIFINAKDIPFAAGFTWSLYYLARSISCFPNPTTRESLKLGGALGLTLGVRIGGVLLLTYYAVFAAIYLFVANREKPDTQKLVPSCWSIVRSVLLVVAIAYPLMLVFWPAALLHPLTQPVQTLQAISHFATRIPVLWNGDYILSTEVPWNYLPLLLAVKLPEILVLLAPCVLLWGGVRIARTSWRSWPPSTTGPALLLLAILFPPLWAILNKSTLYDNLRQFIFILPPLCCLTGLALKSWAGVYPARPAIARSVVCGGLLLGLGTSAASMATLHPYEYTYLNRFAGGLPAGAKNFETDYWLTSYREAAAIVINDARNQTQMRGIPFDGARFTVALIASSSVVEELFPPQFELYDFGLNEFSLTPSTAARGADYLIATTRWGGDRNWPEYRTIGTVRRHGVVYAVVKAAPTAIPRPSG